MKLIDPTTANHGGNRHYPEFLELRLNLGLLHVNLAAELGISPRALTERVTGRAVIKRETILAMKYLLEDRNGTLPGIK